MERRIMEAARLGYRKIYISKFVTLDKSQTSGIELVRLADIPVLVKTLFR